MTHKQHAILNSLVTFAAENVPGGLSQEEQEVAKIVGWAFTSEMSTELIPQHQTHVYKIVNASTGRTMADVANQWAVRGWRVVSVVSDTRPGFAHSLVLERPIGVTHPDD